MAQIEHKSRAGHLAGRAAVAVAASLVCLGLLASARASAAQMEQVGCFAGSLPGPVDSCKPVAEEKFSEEVQLGGVGGMAVNYTGAGGVPAGTVYAATKVGGTRIAVYEPSSEGGLQFSQSWQVTVEEEPYERCGPALGVTDKKADVPCMPHPKRVAGFNVDVEVDQTTGNVYVLNEVESIPAGAKAITEYSADGAEVIARFGEKSSAGKTTAETPAQIHGSLNPGGMAVSGAGAVYVYDENGGADNFYHRLMKFRPESPGDFEHYVYAGSGEDVGAGFSGEGKPPTKPVGDAAGDLYVAGEDYVETYDPSNPGDPPICHFEFAKGGITALTVNPASGEAFFASYKKEAGVKYVHQLASCNKATGKIEEIGKFEVAPERDDLWGLAFDPLAHFTAARPAGVLYGGAGDPVPDTGGKGEPGQSSLGYIFAPAEENPPVVVEESVSKATAKSAQLHALIEPKGFQTRYAFQYLTEAEYQADEPDTRQALTVSAQAGTYTLAPTTAQGSGTLKAGTKLISGVSASLGSFRVGDAISAAGIPPGTTIAKVIVGGQLELSQAASASGFVQLIATETTAPIPYNAAAAGPSSVQGSLNALPGVAVGEVTSTGVTVSGGEEVSPDERSYSIVFSGPVFTDFDVPAMSADSSALAGASHSATIQVTHHGGAGFAGGVEEAPAGGALLTVTGGAQSAAATLVGLAPDTAYRYRVVATSNCAPSEPSKVCEDAGSAQAFHTYPAQTAGLPDARAYELVSPADKHGGQVFPAEPQISSCLGAECKPGALNIRFPMQSAPDGEAIAYEGTPFSLKGGAVSENEYLARRGALGWSTANLSPELLQNSNVEGYKAFSTDLGWSLITQTDPALNPKAPSGYGNLYTQPSADPSTLTPILNQAPPHRPADGAGSFSVSYAGASADLSRIFFAANDALTEAGEFAPAAVDGGAGKNNLYEWEPKTGQLRLVNVKPGNLETQAGASFGAGSAHAISGDGFRAFWSDESGQVYVREDAQATRAIPDAGKFLAAASDGSRVLLQDGLLYDLESETSVDLSAGKGGFQGIVGQSDDLSSVYFVDTALLSGEEENSEGAKARAGKSNLYAWQGGTTRFVATLAAGDNGGGSTALTNDWALSPAVRTAQASPGGGWVAFLSLAPLTGYDNTGPCESNSKGGFVRGPCPEVFLYEAATGKLRCASCNPSGSKPLGWSILRKSPVGALARYLTDSGRLYFDSQDSLSPFDTNEGAEDVYEFEPTGIGDCKREGGCVALISAGREGADSNFLAADATGKNVFFTSRDRLVGADSDELIDLYDAREGGGFTEQPEPPPAKEPLQIPPSEPIPASPTLQDPGNVKPAKGCKKGQVKKKGKCVKKKQGKGKKARKSTHGHGGSK